ncbi:MAG: HEAT repeat domain-containing protein [Thermoflexales bacterium]|nr:HEAT repeat domain-containing protein [Thermoflexales bacterium]
MITITNIGGLWGSVVAYAAFLNQVGVGALPWVMMFGALGSILAIAVYSIFVDRVSNDALMLAIFVFGIVSIGLGLVLLALGQPGLAYPLLSLLCLAWLAVFNPHFTTYVNSFYDIQAAKRVLPVVSAGARAGTVIAGLSMPFLTTRLEAWIIVVIWLLSYVVAMGVIWLTPYLLREKQFQAAPASSSTLSAPGKPRASYTDSVREGFSYTLQSPYLRWMAIATLLLMVLMALVEYLSSGLLTELYRAPDRLPGFLPRDLAGFLALLGGLGSLVALPTLLFAMNRLIARLGLGNVGLIFPIGNLFACFSLALVPLFPALAGASVAYLDRTAFRAVFQLPVDSLLYNAVPLRVKGRARAFVNGLIVPVGTLVGGLLLLLLRSPALGWLISALIGVLAVVYLASTFVIRRLYAQALVKMLEQEDYSFLLSQEAAELTVADPSTLTQLHNKLQSSTNYELTVFIAQLISQVGGKQAVPILAPAAMETQDARTRAAMVDVLVATGLTDGALNQLYAHFLTDPAGEVRQSAITGLEVLVGPADPGFRAQMLGMVDDPDLAVRTRVLSALMRSGDFYQLAPAVQALECLLDDEDPLNRTRGVRVLGRIDDERATRRLAASLSDPADEVRLEAALAAETLVQESLPASAQAALVDGMNGLLSDPVERVRQAALVVLGHAGGQASHQAMVDALADPSPQVRTSAVNALAQAGKAVIPLVHPKLNSPDPQMRKMASVILSRVSPREFGPLISGTHVMGNLLSIYSNHGLLHALGACSTYASTAVLCSALRERNQRLAEEIFYLLTAIHAPESVKVISDSLHSESAHARANASEALEALTTPQIARLMSPLFDPTLQPEQLLSLSQDTWQMKLPDAIGAIKQLITQPDDPWLRTITAFALGELGAALADAKADVELKLEKRRRPPADLFGALAGDEAEDKAEAKAELEAETKELRPKPPFAPADIEAMLTASLLDPVEDVRLAAQMARQVMDAGSLDARFQSIKDLKQNQREDNLLSPIEKIIFLKEIDFFQGMTVDQLRALANVCEEELVEKDARIFNEGDPGGVLYVVVNGKVGIELEKRAGSFARLTDVGAHACFGEMSLFDNSPRSASAMAIQDTLVLKLRREPLIALARQNPELSLELINVLSRRLREANELIAERTRSRPRELHKLFDQFE